MLMLLVLTISISFSYGQKNAELSYKCITETETVTVEAVYTGAGTPLTVVWSYSGDPGTTLDIVVSSCTVFGSVPSGFPNVSYKCVTTHPSLSPNTYQLILTEVQSDELKETWGVTFTPPVGAAPAAVQLPIPDDCLNCICECDCECRTIVIVSIVFGILGALGLLIIVVGIPAGCLNERETLLLASGVIGIVSDVLSLVLSIVVKVKECCECCEENCEDSECCKDWIDKAATAFIVIPCVAIVVSVVIVILVKLDIIRPGNDAYKAKEAKHPDENHGMTGTSM